MNIIKVRQDTVGTRTKLVKLVQIELVQSFLAIGLGEKVYPCITYTMQVAEAGGNSVRVWVHVEGDSRCGNVYYRVHVDVDSRWIVEMFVVWRCLRKP